MIWFFLYPLLKFLIYVCVVQYGLAKFQYTHSWGYAVLVAFLRVLLGLGIAIPIVTASEWLQGHIIDWHLGEVGFFVIAYVSFYLPLRWIAWSLIATIVNPAARSIRGFIFCSGWADARWRGIAVLASCAIDLLLIAMTGTIPIGKFFC